LQEIFLVANTFMPGQQHFTLTMKIEAITLREIQLPLVQFFETSFGRSYSRRILLVTVHSDGIKAWIECVAGEDPFYSSEWIERAWLTISRYLAPAQFRRRTALSRILESNGWQCDRLRGSSASC